MRLEIPAPQYLAFSKRDFSEPQLQSCLNRSSDCSRSHCCFYPLHWFPSPTLFGIAGVLIQFWMIFAASPHFRCPKFLGTHDMTIQRSRGSPYADPHWSPVSDRSCSNRKDFVPTRLLWMVAKPCARQGNSFDNYEKWDCNGIVMGL